MPGIVGLVQSDGADVSEIIAASARKLLHLDTLTMRSGTFDGVGLAQVWRDEPRPDRDWFDEDDFAVRVAGHVLVDGPSPRRIDARALADAYRQHGRIPAEDYDGAFVVVVVDRRRRRVTVTNDRIGALPVYFARNGRAFAFGPEAKSVVAAAGLTPRLDQDGVASFIIFGYCMGDASMFAGVRHLDPASTLTINVDSLEHQSARYWNLRFQASPALGRRADAENTHYEVLLASQRLILCDNPASFEVLLSGGLDSRGVIALSKVLGRPPAVAFTWGARDPQLNTDAFLARRVAEYFQVPHRYLTYESGDFVSNAHDWTYISELANDNVGWYSEGQPTLARVYRSGATFAIAGDVAWDSGGYAFNEMQMRRGVLPPGLPLPLVASLRPARVDDYQRVYDATIQRVLATCQNDDLTDRKEYLYLNGRMARYVLSLGYYREHAIEVRRPFLTKAALEMFASMPQKYRVEKNVYISMMHRRFPQLMAIPDQSGWSLPDWETELRSPTPLREQWLRYTDRERVQAGVLGEVFNPDAFAARRTAFFEAEPVPPWVPPLKARFPLRSKVLPYIQRSKTLDRLSRIVRTGPGFLPRSDFDLMRCAVLVTMLEESLDRFGSARAR